MIARRLMLAAAMSLCALTGAMLFSVPAALAVTQPVIEEEGALDVAGTSATLQAKINPEGNETTYRFEYGTSEAYGSDIPVPDRLLGSDSVGLTVSAHPQGLTPSTTYHYRVVALVASSSETVVGGDGTFTTQPVGSQFTLLDGRQWEQVSPQNKQSAIIAPIGEKGLAEASETGGAMTYIVGSPTEAESASDTGIVQVLSKRGSDGWSSRDIATPHAAPTGLPRTEYSFFSADLSLALVAPFGPFTQLSPEATERTVYMRHDSACEVTLSSCYEPLVADADVPPGTKFGGESIQGSSEVGFAGATADLSHVILGSGVPLTSRSSESDALYEWSKAGLKLVSILPANEGGGVVRGALGDPKTYSARNAISSDGSRVVFSVASPDRLFVRDTGKEETVRVNSPQGDVVKTSGTEPDEPEFEIANKDGSKVFFRDAERLTEDSTTGEGEPDLYEFDVENHTLIDLTADHTMGEAANEQDVLGASEDGNSVYVLARGVLTTAGNDRGEKAISGGDNLYLLRQDGPQWSTTFVGTLAEGDEPDWSAYLLNTTARVSSNGRFLAFMSDRSLTGYDNRDANSGAQDEEVYLYDSQLDRIVCASCDPTGGRPVGAFETFGHELLGDKDKIWSQRWIAGNIPGWTPFSVTAARYQSRYLSDSGRLFFNSSDALVPQDVNGTGDVYEYEPQEVGSCTPSSATFDGASGGCVDLISAGTSAGESAFLDASATGEDVFFLTPSQLSSQDTDTSLDVYDAHVCSIVTPCVSPPVSPPPCSTGDSCKVAPSPQPAIFGSPASATFSGTGDIVPSASKPTVKVRSLTRSQKLARALQGCRKHPKRKRAVCERQAGKRYGPKQARSVNAKRRRHG